MIVVHTLKRLTYIRGLLLSALDFRLVSLQRNLKVASECSMFSGCCETRPWPLEQFLKQHQVSEFQFKSDCQLQGLAFKIGQCHARKLIISTNIIAKSSATNGNIIYILQVVTWNPNHYVEYEENPGSLLNQYTAMERVTVHTSRAKDYMGLPKFLCENILFVTQFRSGLTGQNIQHLYDVSCIHVVQVYKINGKTESAQSKCKVDSLQTQD